MTTKFVTKIAAVAMLTLLIGTKISSAIDLSVEKGGGGNGRFSVGLEIALPSGTFGDAAGTGFGASLRYEMPMGDNLGLTGTAGYITYGKKTIDLGGGDTWSYTYSFIPILVGAKYYFTEQQSGFYGMFQLGVTMLSDKIEETTAAQPALYIGNIQYQAATPESTTSTTFTGSYLTYGLGVGYALSNIDLYAGYTTVSSEGASSSWLGLRLAYVFGEK